MIMIASEDASGDFFFFFFFFFLQSPRRELSPTRTFKRPGRNGVQITCSTSGAYHGQHGVCAT